MVMKISVKYLSILFASLFVLYSCDDDTVSYDEINLEVVDGFLNAVTGNIAFTAGTPSYAIEFLVVPGVADVVSVNAYKTFTNAATGSTSNEALLKTYTVNAGEASTVVMDDITFSDLREGLTVDGGELPTDEGDISIGSSWTIRLEPVDGSNADAGIGGGTINVSVLSPFAGDYVVYESAYYRINVESGLTDWTGEVRFIGSVNDTVYSHPDYFGPFAPGDGVTGALKFIVRGDNSIYIPKIGEYASIDQYNFSGNELLNCDNDAVYFTNVPCAGSNVLIEDMGGAHVFKLTYGYYTASGDENEGEREYYEAMEKIVE